MSAIHKWKLLHSEMVLDHAWYKVRKDTVLLPNGHVLEDYFVSVRPDVVVIFPVTVDNEVVLVRQYKHGAQKILTELPAGVIEADHETPIEAAQRELLEETGYMPGDMSEIAVFHANPTKNTNRVHVCLAQNITHQKKQQLDISERIETRTVDIGDLEKLILKGVIAVPESIAAIHIALSVLKQ